LETLVSHTSATWFESVLIRTPNENSVLTLEALEKRESESSGPIFRTGGCNLEGCVRESEISLQTESAAVWAGEPQKALETREKLGRNEKRPAVDLSTPGVKSFGRQS
jgi:hypothetical protein